MNKGTVSLHVGHVVEVDITDQLNDAIARGRAIRGTGATKALAARQMFLSLSALPRESIWYAFIHGADLTSRGAVTYYYNLIRVYQRCR